VRHASDVCATTSMMKGIVDVFVLVVGVASTRQRGVEDAGWGRQGALRGLPCPPGKKETNERGYLRCVGTGCTVTACNRAQRHTGRCMS
jgi:hypothetical protein